MQRLVCTKEMQSSNSLPYMVFTLKVLFTFSNYFSFLCLFYKLIGSVVPSPAKDFGWHDPGFIHSAVMTGLKPSSIFSYRYGRYIHI